MRLIVKFSILVLFLLCSQTAKAEWTKQNTNTLSWLKTIYFVGETKGWIAGSGGTFLKTTDGGKNWQQEKNFTQDTIREIYFTDEESGWLLCERNIYNLGANSPSYLLKTSNGGADWEKIEFSDTKRDRIADIFFDRYGNGLAVGESGVVFKLQNGEKDWKRQTSPIRYLLLDGVFNGETSGTMVGAGGTILFTEDAGSSWKPAVISGGSTSKLNSVFFINEKNGWTVGTQGKIYQTINGGRGWREQNSGVSKDLKDIFFINTAEGWAVGSDGTILHTTTAGNIWTQVNSNTQHQLEKVFFSGEKGWIIGFGGTILSYEKGKTQNKYFSDPPKLQKRN